MQPSRKCLDLRRCQDPQVHIDCSENSNRWAPRDYLDINSILASGRYTRRELLDIAAGHNPGFSPQMFAESLSYLRDIPDREFAAYDASAELITRMRQVFADWENELMTSS